MCTLPVLCAFVLSHETRLELRALKISATLAASYRRTGTRENNCQIVPHQSMKHFLSIQTGVFGASVNTNQQKLTEP